MAISNAKDVELPVDEEAYRVRNGRCLAWCDLRILLFFAFVVAVAVAMVPKIHIW